MSRGTSKLPANVPNSDYAGESDLIERRMKNSQLPVNRLSPELLSRIMLIGTSSDRRNWRWKSRRVESQQVASHVCSYWRDVAINSPLLWTFIHIFRSPPGKWAALYLSRAGPQALLDILINFEEIIGHEHSYPKPGAHEHFANIIRFLNNHDAGASRWRSVFVRASRIDELPVLFKYLNHSSPPGLESVRFEYDNRSTNFGSYSPSKGESSADILGPVDWANTRSYKLLGSSIPGLRELELVSLFWSFCVQTMTPFPSLQNLAITIHNSTEIVQILKLNPQLKCLYLKIDTPRRHELVHGSSESNPTQSLVLPSLRSLYIDARARSDWVSRIFSTIKAPNLYHFTIACSLRVRHKNLASRITTGGSSVDSLGSPGIANGPVYPSIESLDISRFPCKKDEFTRLVTSFPHLTHITIRRKQAEWLSEAPWMVPKLESLAVPSWEVEEAQNALRCAQRGHAIKLVELRTGHMKLIGIQTQASINPGTQMEVVPQYTFHESEEDPYDQGDWQRAWQRLGSLADNLNARVEQDGYDSGGET